MRAHARDGVDTTTTKESVRMRDIKEVLVMWAKFSYFIEERHSEKIAMTRALVLCIDTCRICTWSTLVMWLECRFLDREADGSNPGISML